MGLDMYLYKFNPKRLAYWRKANMIHAWFEKHLSSESSVVDRIENCNYYIVRYADLKDLLDDINAVLEDNSLASELLPTCSGFFFGSLEYDDFYFEYLCESKNILEDILDEYCCEDKFLYWAWW